MPAQGNLAVIRGVGRCDQSPLTGLSPDGALLIRPDDVIGWRANKLPANLGNELGRALSAILSRMTDGRADRISENRSFRHDGGTRSCL